MKQATFIERKGSYDVKADLSKDIPETHKKTNVEESKVDINFDAKNKFEFPDLEKTHKQPSPERATISKKVNNEFVAFPPKHKSKKMVDEAGMGAWNKTHNPYSYKSLEGGDGVNIKKKIEEDFPTLANPKTDTRTISFF